VDVVFKILSALGAVLGGWALIRSYWLTRPKLALLQKTDKGHNKYDGNLWMPEVFVSNLSSQGNAVVVWRAWLKGQDNTLTEVRVREGKVTDSKTGDVDWVFNATPVNVGPHDTIPCKLAFFEIRKRDNAAPLELRLEAEDIHGKHYFCWCRHPL
jgi:hypothetical protein